MQAAKSKSIDKANARRCAELSRLLITTQNEFVSESLVISPRALDELASIVLDFARDIHSGLGIWKAYEAYNIDLFGTPLPLMLNGTDMRLAGIYRKRVRHLLWVLYPDFIPDLDLAPAHQDLQRIADVAAEYLEREFKPASAYDPIKGFLTAPNQHAWDVKRKLVWIARESYFCVRCSSEI